MKFNGCIKLIKRDLSRYDTGGYLNLVKPSMLITFWFRIGTFLISKNNLLAKILCIPIKLIYKINELLTGIQLPLGTRIGGGLTSSIIQE